MGGYLSIGLVYEGSKIISKELNSLVNFFKKKNIIINEVQYSQDEDGEKWIKRKVGHKNINYNSITDNHYLSLKMIGDVFKVGTQYFVIRVNKENGFFGFLIDIEWNQLIDKNKDEISERIVNSLIQLLKFTEYDYAFCGHEAEIEYSPDQVMKKNYEFPITLLNLKTKLKLIYGEFNIDGISFQEKSYKIIPIE
ncbi:MAG: hypothetical protein H0Z32_14290 [Bacillaceae bacterium]|nr:hypothetical protein [Bacillaceae bacterium]